MCQRHAHSRLLITKDLFEALMPELHVLPRFREFVPLFGAIQKLSEVGIFQLSFRRLPTASSESMSQPCAGFGTVCLTD